MESVGRLAGGVAHDFNNLLTIIISYGQLLLAELQPGAIAREYAQETLEAAARAAALTRQLLTFSRKQVLQPKPVQLNDVVEGTEKLLRRLLGPDVAITVTLGADTGVVVADPTQLDQVLVNLAVNARDAMPNGGALAIETASVDATAGDPRWPALAPGRYAMLAVRDTGSGMDETVRARIFDPFFTTKEASRGTGLGLATVYGIVTQAGGSIFVESAIGAGTRFVVLLPAKPMPADESAPAVAIDAPRHAPSPGAQVLLAEDDDHVRMATHRMLAAAGYRVTDSADGRTALEAYDRADPRIDVIVTDMSMPGMNGRDLARTLRARGDGVPIVMVSGFVDPLDDVEIAGLSVLQKPLDGDTLIAAVEAALDRR
jgi:CheY-like chemotaxis protein